VILLDISGLPAAIDGSRRQPNACAAILLKASGCQRTSGSAWPMAPRAPAVGSEW
jgi:hypothetical protein